jgi:hypothetical protein
MRRTKTYLAAILATVISAALGFSVPASAGDGVPFRGYADAVITGAEVVGTDLHLSAVAAGKATHIGNYTRTESLILHDDHTFEATIVIAAADGDELHAYATGAFSSAAKAVGVATFTGGTGRFTRASGEYDFVAITPDGYHFRITFEGAIWYPQNP